MNNDVFQLISQSVNTVVTHLILYFFYKNLYGMKYNKFAAYVAVFIAWTALTFWINNFNNPLLNMLYGFLSSEVICVCLFKTTIKNSILYNTLIILIGIFSDAVTFFIWSAFLGKTTFEIYNNEQLTFISNLLNVLLFYIFYRIFLLIATRSDVKDLRIKETIFLLLVTVFENFVVYMYTLKISSNTDGIIIIIIILICFLFFNIFITYLIKTVSDTYEYKYKNLLLSRQNKLQLENYRDLDFKYNQSRKIIHDMKKHLSVYKDLKDKEESEEYRKMMENEIDKLFRGYQCSNTILSIIISQMYAQAEKMQINVNIRMEDLTLSFINDLDITAIFANLWDNAIEACKDIEPQKRKIDFVMRKVNGFALINMENSCRNNEFVYDKNGDLISSKCEHMGIGLTIVESTVKKYKGFFYIKRDKNEKFIVELTIPIQ